ncbi:MAG: T9SS type A sorting domain-containing protein [Bacteroidales bacterium]|nr:T9SS type A sorting domain-containing protein [Bacteroidales bacterium]
MTQTWCNAPTTQVCYHDAGWDCDPFDSTNTCTNNIMDGTAYSRHFSALQCGRIQRALQVSSLRHFAYGEENPPDLHITRNQLVDYSRRYYQNVIVDSGVTLTISCQVEMSPNARLIVRPGGKLIVDGGTITSACAGEIWHAPAQIAQLQAIAERNTSRASVMAKGRAVRTRFIASANSQTATVDVRNVPAGVYLLRVTDREGKEYGRKVTIQ